MNYIYLVYELNHTHIAQLASCLCKTLSVHSCRLHTSQYLRKPHQSKLSSTVPPDSSWQSCRQLFYQEQVGKAKDKLAREEAEKAEAREDFTRLLRHTKSLKLDSTWEVIKPDLETHSAYKDVGAVLSQTCMTACMTAECHRICRCFCNSSFRCHCYIQCCMSLHYIILTFCIQQCCLSMLTATCKDQC